MNRNVLILGVLVLVIVVIVGLVFWSTQKNQSQQTSNYLPGQEGKTISDDIKKAIEEATTTMNLAISPEVTPTAWPTPERVIASKAKGNEMMQELNQRTREVQDGLLELRKQGKDTRDYQSRLRKLNLDLSQAGYQLYKATDTVNTQAAEEHIMTLREQMNALATEAGVQ